MKEKKINIVAEDCIRIGDYLYMIALDYNAVFRVKIDNGNVELITSIPEEDRFSRRLGAKILLWGDELIFSPMNAKKIWRYNINTQQWKSHERKKIDDWKGSELMFQAVLYNDKVFFVGTTYPAIIMLNLKNDEMKYIEEPYLEYKELAEYHKDVFFRTDAVKVENKVYMASCLKNEIFEFNLDTFDYRYIEVGDESFTFSGIDYDGSNFYISPRRKGPLLIWDGQEKYTAIDVFEEGIGYNGYTFGGVLCKRNSVIFSNTFGQNSFILENKNDISTIKYLESKYLFNKKIDEKTFVSLTADGYISIDDEDCNYSYKLQVSIEDLINFIVKQNVKKPIFIKETERLGLDIFQKLI